MTTRCAIAMLIAALISTAASALDVPINLIETAGVARVAEPVSVGVPLPRDVLLDTSRLCVLDPSGKKVPAQFEVLMRWFPTPRFPNDKKGIRWVLVDFQADVPANGKATYRLADTGPGPAHPTPVMPTPDNLPAGTVMLSTGPMGFAVRADEANGFSLFESVSLGRQQVVAADGANGIAITGMDGKSYSSRKDLVAPPAADSIAYRSLDTYLKHNPHNPAGKISVAVEKSGPVRTVIRVDGVMRAMSKNGPGGEYEFPAFNAAGERTGTVKLPLRDESLAFRARIHAYAGQPFLRVFFTFINPRGLSHTATDQNRYRSALYIAETANVAGNYLLKSLDLNVRLNASGPVSYRFGGDAVHEGKFSAEGPDSATLYQDSSAGWIWQAAENKIFCPVLKANAEFFNKAGSPLDNSFHEFSPIHYKILTGQDGYSFMGYRLLDRERKQQAGGNRAAGWVHASDGKVGVTTAMRHFWQMCPKSLVVGSDGRVGVGILPSQWPRGHFLDGKTRRTHELLYRFDAGDAAGEAETAARAFNEPLVAYCDFDWYLNSGACGLFARPDEKNWPTYEAQIKTAVHVGVNPKLNSALDSSFAIEREKDDAFGWEHFGDTAKRGFRGHSQFQEFDCSQALLMHFLRTGDLAFFREAEILARFLANIPCFGGGYGHQHPEPSHNWIQGLIDYWCLTGSAEAKDGIDIMEGYYRDCQNEKAFCWHYNGRNAAYAINGLRQFYELTGDETWARAANVAIRSVRRRTRPVSGFYGGNPADFMQHVLARAAGRYALLTGDPEAIDLVLGMACYFKPFSGQGGGPGAADVYAYATLLTGQREYLDAAIKNCNDSASAGPGGPQYRTGTGSSKTWSQDIGGGYQAFFYALNHWKPADQTPPAVTDLAAEPTKAAGEVKLTLSGVGPGQRVLVKHAVGEIVENIPWGRKGMDATIEPEWKDKVNFWYADNATLSHPPAVANGKAELTVTGLPSGRKLFIAVKLVDTAGNRGALSNCISVTVP